MLNPLRILYFLTTAIVLLTMAACRDVNNLEYSRFESIPDQGWDPIDVLGFDIEPADSMLNPGMTHDLLLSLRHNENLNSRIIKLAVHYSDGGANNWSDTLLLCMTDSLGNYLGRHSLRTVELTDTVRKNLPMNTAAHIDVESLSEPAATRGLTHIGLLIKRR